jgi:hypothetical protein
MNIDLGLFRASFAVLCSMVLFDVQAANTVYRCPGNVYTDTISAKEAQERGCRTLEGPPVTVIETAPPRTESKPVPAQPGSTARASKGRSEAKVDPGEQRLRDAEARRILEAELSTETERMASLQKEYNNGEPERRGEERNFQKYLDRTAELKASIARKESDIAALKRELAKLPQ